MSENEKKESPMQNPEFKNALKWGLLVIGAVVIIIVATLIF